MRIARGHGDFGSGWGRASASLLEEQLCYKVVYGFCYTVLSQRSTDDLSMSDKPHTLGQFDRGSNVFRMSRGACQLLMKYALRCESGYGECKHDLVKIARPPLTSTL